VAFKGLAWLVPARQSLKISYSDGVVVRFGGNFKTLSVGWQYGWFGLPFRTSVHDNG
jgi:hypothetical protein